MLFFFIIVENDKLLNVYYTYIGSWGIYNKI